MSYFNEIQRSLWGLSKIAGLEITILPDGKILAAGVILEIKKDIIHICDKVENLTLDELKSKISIDIPLVLSFCGKGIIGKPLDSIDGHGDIAGKIIPNATSEDFYTQQTQIANKTFVSLIRKENLDEYLGLIEEQGFFCIGVNLLGLPIRSLLSVINVKNSQHQKIGNHSFSVNESDITDYKYQKNNQEEGKSEIIKIGDDELDSNLALGYAFAFQHIARIETDGFEIDKIRTHKGEYSQKKIFKSLGIGLLSFFFVLLLANYFAFSNLNDKNNANAFLAGKNKALLIKRDSLRNRTQEMERFLKEAGWQTASKTSYFADEIGASVPKSIKLSKLEINPINQSSLSKSKKTSFSNGEILIEGECSSATIINPWVENLKDFEWTKEVNVTDYKFDKKVKKGIFSIKITWI